MEKKLPKVFVNTIEKEFRNNETVYYAGKVMKEEQNSNTKRSTASSALKDLSEMDVKRKINAIFNSPNYIYKADVEIKLSSGIVQKRIVGRNDKHLISIDDELIPIQDILDVEIL